MAAITTDFVTTAYVSSLASTVTYSVEQVVSSGVTITNTWVPITVPLSTSGAAKSNNISSTTWESAAKSSSTSTQLSSTTSTSSLVGSASSTVSSATSSESTISSTRPAGLAIPYSTSVIYSATLTAAASSGSVISGYIYPPVLTPLTTLLAAASSGSVLSGYVNATVPIIKKAPSGISTGATAGIAIGTAIIGALIAGLIAFMVSRRRKSHQSRQHYEPATFVAAKSANEKAGPQTYTAAATDDAFDLDRLLPQPQDDSSIRRAAEKLFSQIDAHVDSFYYDQAIDIPKNLDPTVARALQDPASRFFMVKRLICRDVLDSINSQCTSDRSLLPRGYTSMARLLREPDIDDQANILSWSRFRTSLAFLLRQDSSSDQHRQATAISTVVDKLSDDLGGMSGPNSNSAQRQDLESLVREGAVLGRTLLAQPAEWKFDWSPLVKRSDGSLVAESRAGLVYFPALLRLTDNKAKKLPTPRLVLPPRYMQ